jgi:hypothetical protein
MLILRGSPALSSFRLQKLLDGLNGAGLPIRALSAEFVHIVGNVLEHIDNDSAIESRISI